MARYVKFNVDVFTFKRGELWEIISEISFDYIIIKNKKYTCSINKKLISDGVCSILTKAPSNRRLMRR